MTTTATALPQTGTYRIDPDGSTITFTTKHLFGAGTVRGKVDVADGDVVIAEPLSASTVRARVASTSFDSGHARRDKEVLSAKFLDAANHPHMEFASRQLESDGSGHTLHGELTVRGGTAPVSLEVVDVRPDGRGFVLTARGRIDRYAHGVDRMKGMAARYLDLEITARALPAGA